MKKVFKTLNQLQSEGVNVVKIETKTSSFIVNRTSYRYLVCNFIPTAFEQAQDDSWKLSASDVAKNVTWEEFSDNFETIAKFMDNCNDPIVEIIKHSIAYGISKGKVIFHTASASEFTKVKEDGERYLCVDNVYSVDRKKNLNHYRIHYDDIVDIYPTSNPYLVPNTIEIDGQTVDMNATISDSIAMISIMDKYPLDKNLFN